MPTTILWHATAQCISFGSEKDCGYNLRQGLIAQTSCIIDRAAQGWDMLCSTKGMGRKASTKGLKQRKAADMHAYTQWHCDNASSAVRSL